MKKEIKQKVRTMLAVNFMAEIIGIITLYLSSINTIKVLKINILGCLFILMNTVGILFIYKLVKKEKNEKTILLISLFLELLVIVFSILSKTKNIVPYIQTITDLLKFLVILNLYKKSKKVNKKKEIEKKKKLLIIMGVTYFVSKICYVLINIVSGITVIPIISTLYIIGIVVTYTLYLKELEKE